MDLTEMQRQISNERHPWEIVRARIAKTLIKKTGIPLSHFLDIGSGDAYVLSQLCTEYPHYKFTAIDSAYTDEIIRQLKLKINCPINFYTDLSFTPGVSADCILLMDVLEHCADDAAVLMQAKSHCQKDAIFFITVPAFQTFYSYHDKLLGHFRRYTEKHFRTICEKQGFNILESGYFFSSLLLIRVIQLFLEKMDKEKSGKTIDNWRSGKIISITICTLLWIDFKISQFFLRLGVRLPGLSVYCICQPLP